jgi:hypothetical protein
MALSPLKFHFNGIVFHERKEEIRFGVLFTHS